jgi:hypothetical protein
MTTAARPDLGGTAAALGGSGSSLRGDPQLVARPLSVFQNVVDVEPFNAFSAVANSWQTGPVNDSDLYETAAVGSLRNYLGSVSTTVSGVAYNGEWIQLQMPLEVYADKLVITKTRVSEGTDHRQVGSVVVAGSNDGAVWSLISEHIDLPYSTQSNLELVTSSTAKYSYVRLIVMKMYDYPQVIVRQIRILQASRDAADVGKIKNVIGFDDASAELRNGTGGTNLLARVAAVEAVGGGGANQSEVVQLQNALGLSGTEPITRHPQLNVTDSVTSNTFTATIGTYTANASTSSTNPYWAFDCNPVLGTLMMRIQASTLVPLKPLSTVLRSWASGSNLLCQPRPY